MKIEPRAGLEVFINQRNYITIMTVDGTHGEREMARRRAVSDSWLINQSFDAAFSTRTASFSMAVLIWSVRVIAFLLVKAGTERLRMS